MSVTDKYLIDYLAGDSSAPIGPADREALDDLRALLAEEATWIEPDPSLKERLVLAIAEDAGTLEVAPPVTDTSPAAPARRRSVFRYARLRVLAPALAAGLAATIAAVILIASRGPALTQFSVILHGTALAPGAGGRATLTKTNAGWRVNLTAHGLLLRKQNETYYQAWLKNQAGDLVPIGTFNQPADITMWSGVSPQHGYTTLTVTRQQASMTTTSSRQTVLTGVAHPNAKH
jgi:hypothetical protein